MTRGQRWFGIVAVTIIAALFAVNVMDDDAPATVTSRVDGADRDRVADDEIKVPEAVVAQVKRSEVGEHEGLGNEAPRLAPESQLVTAKKQEARVIRTQAPLPVAGASQGFPGCVTRFIGANSSSRNGVRPQLIVDHYTVSPNRLGWSDVNGIVVFFGRAATRASSNFVIDAEGHCAYIVPIERKAWTQAAGNPISVSIEVIATGRETRFMEPAGYAKLAAVHREIGRRAGIPMRRGSVYPLRKGIVQHKDGGLSWGGHVDITPFSIAEVVRITMQVTGVSRLVKVERAVADKRCYHRRQYLAGRNKTENLKWARYWRARILFKSNRSLRYGGHVQLIPGLDAARARDHKPWSYRHRGARRAELARIWEGKGC